MLQNTAFFQQFGVGGCMLSLTALGHDYVVCMYGREPQLLEKTIKTN